MADGIGAYGTTPANANMTSNIGLNLSISQSVAGGTTMTFTTQNDVVLNATGAHATGNDASLLLEILDGVSLGVQLFTLVTLPELGITELVADSALSTFLQVFDISTSVAKLVLEHITSVSPPPSDVGSYPGASQHNDPKLIVNGFEYQKFGIAGGTSSALGTNNFNWQDVFAAGNNASLQIPLSIRDYAHYYSIMGQTNLNSAIGTQNTQDSFNFSAMPAVEVTGNVTTPYGAPASNASVYIGWNTTINGTAAQEVYEVNANQYGLYRFFAPPNETYFVSANYSTPFGSSGNTNKSYPGNTFSNKPGDTLWANFTEQNKNPVNAAIVSGTVKDRNGNPIWDASVTISKGGESISTQTNESGYYFFGIPAVGTYSIDATASGYNLTQGSSVSITNFNQSYPQGTLKLTGLVSSLPSHVLHYVQLLITNNQDISTPPQYDQMLTVNSSSFFNFEAQNLSNVEFFYANGTVIPSWLESGNLRGLNNSLYWLKLDGLAARSSVTIYMGFASPSTILWGSASNG
jgi:hypothetical protein